MDKTDARYAAYNIITDVLNNKAYYNLSLKKHLGVYLSGEDRRFAACLSALCIERLITIDYYLKYFIRAKRVHKGIMNILRMGACQIMFMNVPESAAVNESVKLAKTTGKQALSGFVNGTLRNFSANYKSIQLPDKNTAGYISVKYGFPIWLVNKITKQRGFEQVLSFFSYQADNTKTSVRINTLKTDMAEAENILKKAGLDFSKAVYIDQAFEIKNISDIENLGLYGDGKIAVMGISSMIAVQSASCFIKEGFKVLDACAAPGGKTAYMAALFSNNIEITAWDINKTRTEIMEKNFKRLGVKAKVEVKDASVYDSAFKDSFDIVIVDAPCSALGLVHKKPDIRHNRNGDDIKNLNETQAKIISACAKYVKTGGILAYFTCTVLKEENEDIINGFLKSGKRFKPKELKLPDKFMERGKNGTLAIWPHIDGMDGFFIALLERTS